MSSLLCLSFRGCGERSFWEEDKETTAQGEGTLACRMTSNQTEDFKRPPVRAEVWKTTKPLVSGSLCAVIGCPGTVGLASFRALHRPWTVLWHPELRLTEGTKSQATPRPKSQATLTKDFSFSQASIFAVEGDSATQWLTVGGVPHFTTISSPQFAPTSWDSYHHLVTAGLLMNHRLGQINTPYRRRGGTQASGGAARP